MSLTFASLFATTMWEQYPQWDCHPTSPKYMGRFGRLLRAVENL